MAWNEPGNGDRDPWSGKGKDQGPPDLDEVVRNLQNKLGSIFGGGKGNKSGSGDNQGAGKSAASIFMIVLVVIVVVLGVKSFYTIQPAERGVITRFGAYSATVEPGPHFLIPIVDQVFVIDVDNISKFTHRAQMLTKDENIVDLTLTVQYKIQDAADYLFQDARPDVSIKGAMETSLRSAVGNNKLDEIITSNRSGVAASVKEGTQELLNLYRTGIIVTNISIQDANPPEQVQEAFDDATKAQADKERAQNRAQAYANDIVPRARGAGARQVEEAKAYKSQLVAQAKGESARFLSILKEYQAAPEVTRERLYLDTVQTVLTESSKVLLDSKSSNNLTYLPLDKMIGNKKTNMKRQKLPTVNVSNSDSSNFSDSSQNSTRNRRAR